MHRWEMDEKNNIYSASKPDYQKQSSISQFLNVYVIGMGSVFGGAVGLSLNEPTISLSTSA